MRILMIEHFVFLNIFQNKCDEQLKDLFVLYFIALLNS